jgi:hypothetical protein
VLKVVTVARTKREEREIIKGGTGGQSLPRLVLPGVSVRTPGHGEYPNNHKSVVRVSVPKDTEVKNVSNETEST